MQGWRGSWRITELTEASLRSETASSTWTPAQAKVGTKKGLMHE